jgi:hypothetical protein
VTPDGLPLHHQRPIHSTAKPGRPGTGYNFEHSPADVGSDIDPLTLDPAQGHRIQSHRVEEDEDEDEDESLAPSQSLSQSAFRNKKRPLSQQPPVPAFQPISALKGARRRSLQQPPLPPLPPLDDPTMEGVLDWAGSVRPGSTRAASPKSRRPGSRQHHRPSRSGTSRRGGTNVDEPQPFGRDAFEETPPSSRKRPQSKAGTGWSQVYPPSESETPTGSPLPALPNDWQSSHRAQSVHAPAGGGWESPAITDETPESEMMSRLDRMTLGARSGITGLTGVTGMP